MLGLPQLSALDACCLAELISAEHAALPLES
jgi:hypothetical protein